VPRKRRTRARIYNRFNAGILVILVSAYAIFHTLTFTIPVEKRFARKGEYVSAKVVKRFTSASKTAVGLVDIGGAELPYLTVRYILNGERQEYTGRVRESFFYGTRLGERVMVQVIPGNDEMRRIRDGSEPAIMSRFVFAGFGILGGLGLIFWHKMRSWRRRQERRTV